MTLLVLSFAAALFGVVALSLRRRSPYASGYLIAWVVVYFVDGAYSLANKTSFVSPTITYRLIQVDTGPDFAVAAIAGAAVVAAFGLTGRHLVAPPRRPATHRLQRPPWSRSIRRRALLGLALAIIVMGTVLASVPVSQVLAQRQTVFAHSPARLLALYLLPVATAVTGSIALEKRSVREIVGSLVGLCLVFATGSRSSLLFSLILPVAHHYFGSRVQWSSARRVLARTVAVLAVLAVSLALAGPYVKAFRGVDDVASQNLLESPDISSADATLVILDLEARSSGNTYLAAPLFAVPRSAAPWKPPSGNQAASEAIAPVRYQRSQVETASSVLGEGILNYGPIGGGLAAGLVVCVYVAMTLTLPSRLIRDPELARLIQLVLLYRGINVIRSDLLNVIVPLAVALAFGALLSSPRSTRIRRPPGGGSLADLYRTVPR